MLTITLLGTAATMPLPDRALSTAFAACGGHGLLFDCGEGTQAAARRAGVNLMRADAVCLTHYHGDHIFGLPGLLQTLGAQGRTRPLLLVGPKGLAGIWSAVRALTGPLPYAVRLQEADGPLALDALSEGWPAGAVLRPFATRHRVPSVGYRLELPRAGRFDPARARALGVPVQQWKLLQQGQSVLVKGRTVAPAEVLGAPRRGLSMVFSGDTAPCAALEQANYDFDSVYIVSEDGDETGLRLVEKGQIDATLVLSGVMYGTGVVDAAYEWLQGNNPPAEYQVDIEVATPDNVADYLAKLPNA